MLWILVVITLRIEEAFAILKKENLFWNPKMLKRIKVPAAKPNNLMDNDMINIITKVKEKGIINEKENLDLIKFVEALFQAGSTKQDF